MMKGKRVEYSDIDSLVNGFLKGSNSIVFGFKKDGNTINHHIFKGSAKGLFLINPFFGANGASYFRRLFQKGTEILFILRPCEIRAYIELTKLTQIEKEAIIAVSVDCPGTFSQKNYDESSISLSSEDIKDYFHMDGKDIRWACHQCREKRGIVGDAGIRLDKEGGLWLVPYTEKGETLVSHIGGEIKELPEHMALAPGKQPDSFKTDMDNLRKDLERCLLCKNCRDMCPVCYCIDCVFNGDEYLPKGDALLNKILRTGSVEMPQGKELFHLIRMYHVSQTCIGCGGCEEACPQNIPLTKYFKGVSERLQGIFSYMAGKSFDEPIPYTTFLEDELKDAAD